MKQTYIISTLVFLCNIGFSQMDAVYYYNIPYGNHPKKEQTIYLSFYPDNFYLITLESFIGSGIDDIWTVGPIISYGTYKHKNEELILTDNENTIKMSIKKNGKETLYFEQSFNWLRHKEFKLSSIGTEIFKEEYPELFDINKYDMIYVEYGASTMKEKRNLYIQQNQGIYPFIFGEYIGDNSVNAYMLIHPDNSYHIKFRGEYNFCFSEGSWSREGNLLIMFDASLQQSFHMLVGDGLIQCVPFPFCHDKKFRINSGEQIF